MALEKELKILEVPEAKVRKKLKELKAKKIFGGKMEIYYYDFPNCKIRKSGALLRVRKVGKEFEFTYKEKVKGATKGIKVREELETHVKDINILQDILGRIGLKNVFYYEKKRTSYLLKGARIELDYFPNKFCCLEVEAGSAQKIKEIIKLLELSEYPTSTKSVNGLFDEMFGKDSLSNLRFKK